MKSSLLRKLSIALALLVVLGVAAGVWLVSSFDANAYKGQAIDWVKTHRDRTLTLGGPVSLSVFPRLSVKLSEVSLSEKGKAREFAALNSVSLSVQLMPLLRGQLRVDQVQARGLRLVYWRDEQGHSNIDDLLSPSDKPASDAPPSEASGPAKALDFDVSGIQLEDLRLSVRDDLSKVSGEVSVNSLRTGRLADKLKAQLTLDAQLALKTPALQGRLNGQTDLRFDSAQGSLQLSDMQWQWLGDVPGLRLLDAKLKGSLSMNTRQRTLAASDIELQWGGQLGKLHFADSSLKLAQFDFDPAAKRMNLAGLGVRVAGQNDGHPLSLALDWPHLAVADQSLSGSALSGSLSQEGPQSLSVKFQSGAPAGSFERLSLPGFQATLAGSQGPRKLSGNLGAQLWLNLAAKSLNIEALTAQWQIAEPSLQPLSLSLQGGSAQASAQAASWSLAGAINGNPFKSVGELRLSDSPLSVQASADFKTLDLNRLLPPPAAAANSTAATPSTRPASAGGAAPPVPIDLSFLNAMQGRFTARVGDFSYRQYRVANLALDAALQNGLLKLSRLDGAAWRGQFNASLSADARSNRLAVKATAQGVDVQALLKDVAQKDVLEGKGRVALDIDTAGRNSAELKSHLHGTASLQLQDGAIKGVNLAASLRRARATLSLKQDAKQSANPTEKTDFSELSASFKLQDGVAHSSDLAMKSPFLRLGGEGSIDIGRNRIDYLLRSTVAETSKGQGGAELAALRGVTVPVRLTGPLEAIEWNIRWSEVATQLVKTELGGRLQEQLKDGLRNKLGPAPAGGAASAPAQNSKDALKQTLRGLFK